MNEVARNEQLSAFLDNELSELEERRLLTELQRDETLRGAWDRYHMIRSALRGELESIAPPTLSQAVAKAIAADQAPRRTLTASLGKAGAGLAIAASVATVAILSLQAPLTAKKETAPVAQSTVTPAGKAVAANDARQPAAANPLNAYLVEHNEFSPTSSMGSLLPYVRTVDSDEKK